MPESTDSGTDSGTDGGTSSSDAESGTSKSDASEVNSPQPTSPPDGTDATDTAEGQQATNDTSNTSDNNNPDTDTNNPTPANPQPQTAPETEPDPIEVETKIWYEAHRQRFNALETDWEWGLPGISYDVAPEDSWNVNPPTDDPEEWRAYARAINATFFQGLVTLKRHYNGELALTPEQRDQINADLQYIEVKVRLVNDGIACGRGWYRAGRFRDAVACPEAPWRPWGDITLGYGDFEATARKDLGWYDLIRRTD